MPPALPGFCYDAERKKYFKIQADHVAASGSASKYSKAAVKREAEEQRERKRRKLHDERERKMRVQRSRMLASPLGGGCGVTREHGVTVFERSTMMRAWAQGLERKKVMEYEQPNGGSGRFLFDSAIGVLRCTEARGGNMHFEKNFVLPDDGGAGAEISTMSFHYQSEVNACQVGRLFGTDDLV